MIGVNGNYLVLLASLSWLQGFLVRCKKFCGLGRLTLFVHQINSGASQAELSQLVVERLTAKVK